MRIISKFTAGVSDDIPLPELLPDGAFLAGYVVVPDKDETSSSFQKLLGTLLPIPIEADVSGTEPHEIILTHVDPTISATHEGVRLGIGSVVTREVADLMKSFGFTTVRRRLAKVVEAVEEELEDLKEEITGEKAPEPQKEPAALKANGPTLEEYTAAGYKPEAYPPQGYAVVESPGLTAYRLALEEKAGAPAPVVEPTAEAPAPTPEPVAVVEPEKVEEPAPKPNPKAKK